MRNSLTLLIVMALMLFGFFLPITSKAQHSPVAKTKPLPFRDTVRWVPFYYKGSKDTVHASRNLKIQIGTQFPALRMQYKDSISYTSRLKGKYTIIFVWNHQCEGCEEQVFYLNETYPRYAENLNIIYCTDTFGRALDILKRLPNTIPFEWKYEDGNGAPSFHDLFKYSIDPFIIFLDKELIVTALMQGKGAKIQYLFPLIEPLLKD